MPPTSSCICIRGWSLAVGAGYGILLGQGLPGEAGLQASTASIWFSGTCSSRGGNLLSSTHPQGCSCHHTFPEVCFLPSTTGRSSSCFLYIASLMVLRCSDEKGNEHWHFKISPYHLAQALENRPRCVYQQYCVTAQKQYFMVVQYQSQVRSFIYCKTCLFLVSDLLVEINLL